VFIPYSKSIQVEVMLISTKTISKCKVSSLMIGFIENYFKSKITLFEGCYGIKAGSHSPTEPSAQFAQLLAGCFRHFYTYIFFSVQRIHSYQLSYCNKTPAHFLWHAKVRLGIQTTKMDTTMMFYVLSTFRRIGSIQTQELSLSLFL
jgi:hypothetical protein